MDIDLNAHIEALIQDTKIESITLLTELDSLLPGMNLEEIYTLDGPEPSIVSVGALISAAEAVHVKAEALQDRARSSTIANETIVSAAPSALMRTPQMIQRLDSAALTSSARPARPSACTLPTLKPHPVHTANKFPAQRESVS
ncbi:hypothetical protein SVAN01_10442 [Stagonosporopsis vannaccii]|nr:hypothetical protein SVAN01_10442 [Stagonosporopsis vannaccii]